MKRIRGTCLVAAAVAAIAGCAERPSGGCPWRAKEVAVLGGFDAPECALADPATGLVYVSNMVPDPKIEGGEKYWSDDGAGFVSRISADGKIESLRWAESNDAATFHSPKGMCLASGKLWVADNHQVVAVDPATGEPALALEIEGATMLNDMVADGDRAYVSDTGTGRVTCVSPGEPRHMKGPGGANGLAFRGGKLYCVSWSEHELYEIDAAGEAEARATGLAGRFTNLDGIEALPDGSFLVSDQPANRIAWVSPDLRVVSTLVAVKEPADFGIDLARMRLYVPSFQGNCVTIFSLERD